MSKRVRFLLRSDPALFISKLRKRVERRLQYKRLMHKASRELQRVTVLSPQRSELALQQALGQGVPVAILERRRDYLRYAVRDTEVPGLIANICGAEPGVRLLSKSRFVAFDPKELMRLCLTSPGFTLGVPQEGRWIRWRFDIFEATEEGTHVCRSGNNKIVGVFYGDVLRDPGIIDLTARMPELARPASDQPIDIVYTWVNSNDAEWKKAFEKAAPGCVSSDAVSESRFHSNDELRFSLRSAHTYMPWAGKVYIISNCRPPNWLDVTSPLLQWVSHETILASDCLPTFNSHAIEASLHRVPGLSDVFLYFNDDFFAFDHMAPTDFLNENGTLKANLERQAVVNSTVDPDAPDYLNAARNSARLLFDRYGYYPTRLHRHTPYCLSRTLLDEAEQEFDHEFERTRSARFRSIDDINVASFLAHHFGFVKRSVVYDGFRSTLIKSSDPFSILAMQQVARARRRPKVVCLNEGGAPAPTAAWRREAASFMAQEFPTPAPWERGDAD